MDTILYATDCTKNSISTLNYAKNLSETLNAKLIVLHIYDIPPVRTSNIRSSEQLHKLSMIEQKEVLEDYCIKNLNQDLSQSQLIREVAQNTSIIKGIILEPYLNNISCTNSFSVSSTVNGSA